MRSEWIVTGQGSTLMDALVRQLWMPPVRRGQVRVVFSPQPSTRWRTVERFAVVPSPQRPRLLVPDASPAATARMLRSYSRLRRGPSRHARQGLATLARSGLPLTHRPLHVQVRDDVAGGPDVSTLPLGAITQQLRQERLLALVGVLGVNRKVTLQIFDAAGSAVAYAKIGWNTITSSLVNGETAALQALEGRQGEIRHPDLLAHGSWCSLPYVVTAPLPGDVASVGTIAPSPVEIASLFPVVRHATVASTGFVTRLSARLTAMPVDTSTATLRDASLRLYDRLSRSTVEVPVAERWHGDFVPWNMARDGAGHLWCWDWESSSTDVPAGLDSLHWHLNLLPGRGYGDLSRSVDLALEASADHLRAFGVPRAAWPELAAAYGLGFVDQLWSYAVGSDGWHGAALGPDQLVAVLDRLLPDPAG